MPASLKRLKSSGASVFLHTCEVCGADASFGYGVSLKAAINRAAAGDMGTAKWNLGKWFCREHRAMAGDFIE